MDISKINQSQLGYECSVGKATINLFTGRMLFESVDISIGLNSTQIAISHIYNSFELQPPLYTRMGKGWKLNVEQFLYLENEEYVYVDSMGYKHQFKKLKENEYYDTSGLNLILKVSAQSEIIDSIGNKLIFSSTRLIKSISGANSSIYKVFNYDSEAKLKSIYDGRKPGNRMEFSYEPLTGLLSRINSTKDYFEKEYRHYYYDSNQKLIRTSKTVEGVVKQLALYRYSSNKLNTVFSMEDYSALEFEYSLNKITKVKTGVLSYETNLSVEESTNYLGDGLILAEPSSVGEKGGIQNYLLVGNINTYNTNMKRENTIEYETNKQNNHYES